MFLKFGLFIFNTMGHEKSKNLLFLVIYLSSFYFLAVVCFCGFVQAFSSCSEWGLLFIAVLGLLTAVASLVQSTGSRDTGFSSIGAWAFSCSVACGNSWTRDRTGVPCIAR